MFPVSMIDGAWRLVADVVNDLPNKCSRERQRLLVFRPEARRELEPELDAEHELELTRSGGGDART